jgi:hypothetical protein
MPNSLIVLKAISNKYKDLMNLPNGLEELQSDVTLSLENLNSLPVSLKTLKIKYRGNRSGDNSSHDIVQEYCKKNNILFISSFYF